MRAEGAGKPGKLTKSGSVRGTRKPKPKLAGTEQANVLNRSRSSTQSSPSTTSGNDFGSFLLGSVQRRPVNDIPTEETTDEWGKQFANQQAWWEEECRKLDERTREIKELEQRLDQQIAEDEARKKEREDEFLMSGGFNNVFKSVFDLFGDSPNSNSLDADPLHDSMYGDSHDHDDGYDHDDGFHDF